MTGNDSEVATRSIEARIGAIAQLLSQPHHTGLAAELRRMRPGDVDCAAFWKVCVSHLEGEFEGSESRIAELERRWSVILVALASMAGLHRPGRRFGTALARAEVSEARVLKLLHARGDPLADAMRTSCHQLAAASEHVDLAEVARLVLSDGRKDEDLTRRRIARAYYRSMGASQ